MLEIDFALGPLRFRFTLATPDEGAEDETPWQDSTLGSLVERSEPHAIGFQPNPDPYLDPEEE